MAVCNMNRTITLKVLKLHTTVRTLFRDELSTDTLLMGVYKKKVEQDKVQRSQSGQVILYVGMNLLVREITLSLEFSYQLA